MEINAALMFKLIWALNRHQNENQVGIHQISLPKHQSSPRSSTTNGTESPSRLMMEPVGQPQPPPFETCPFVQMKKMTAVASSSSSSPSSPSFSARSNQHKLKLTARLPKLRLRPHRSAGIGLVSDSALQELIMYGHRCKSRPPPQRRQ